MNYLLCAYRDWNIELFQKLSKKYKNMTLLTNPKKLTLKFVTNLNPSYIFFPDWSWIVSDQIVKKFTCVCIHESNLPKFRGGSPIQNQIIRNINKTKSTAFVMNNKLDAGDILLQKELSLKGNINEITDRIAQNNYELITNIIQGKFIRRKQSGKPTVFKRRQPYESELKSLNHPNQYIFNFIRMLEDPYPNAFMRIDGHKIIFKSAKIKGKNIHFEGVIE
jgi:methionyl-tRNA formyltransferase